MGSRIVPPEPEVLGGTPVFVGTRVPVAMLFAALHEAEASLEREQAAA